MPQQSSGIAFPRFKGAVRAVVLVNAAIYVATLLALSFATPLGQRILVLGSLSPEGIRHGWLWQFATYAFIHVDPLQFVFTMLGIYFIGNAVEERIGARRFRWRLPPRSGSRARRTSPAPAGQPCPPSGRSRNGTARGS